MGENKYKVLLKNTFFITLGGALSKVVGFIMLPFLTAWMSTEEYGFVDILSVYASIIMCMTTMCLGESIFVFVKNCPEDERKKYFSTNLMASTLFLGALGVLLFVFSRFAVMHGIHNTISNHPLYTYIFVITGFYQLLTQQFACAINQIRVYSMTGFVMAVTFAALSFLLIPQYKIVGFVITSVVSNIVAIFYTFICSKSYLYFKISAISTKSLKEMLKYSIPVMPNSILGWLASALNRPLMENYLGLSAVGLLALSNRFPQIVQLVFNYITTSWQISMFEEFEKPSFEDFFNRVSKIVFIILFFVVSILSLFCESFISLFVDSKFFESYKYVPILSFATLFLCIAQFLGNFFAVKRQSQYYFYTTFYASLSAVILNFLLIPRIGILGASISLLLSYFIYMMARLYLVRRYIIIHDYTFYLLLILILSILSYLIWIHISYLIISIYYILSLFAIVFMQRKTVENLLCYLKKRVKK